MVKEIDKIFLCKWNLDCDYRSPGGICTDPEAKEELAWILAAEPDPAFRRLWEIYLRTGCRRRDCHPLSKGWEGYCHRKPKPRLEQD